MALGMFVRGRPVVGTEQSTSERQENEPTKMHQYTEAPQ
jgi:hypothetical protein